MGCIPSATQSKGREMILVIEAELPEEIHEVYSVGDDVFILEDNFFNVRTKGSLSEVEAELMRIIAVERERALHDGITLKVKLTYFAR